MDPFRNRAGGGGALMYYRNDYTRLTVQTGSGSDSTSL